MRKVPLAAPASGGRVPGGGCHRGLSSPLKVDRASIDERRSVVLYAAIDSDKHAFQATVLDPESGEVVEERFSADLGSLERWAGRWRGRVAAVGDRGDGGLALGLARARRARLRGVAGRAGAGARAARTPAQREDGSSR